MSLTSGCADPLLTIARIFTDMFTRSMYVTKQAINSMKTMESRVGTFSIGKWNRQKVKGWFLAPENNMV